MSDEPTCSFCGKKKSQVFHMVAGTGKVGPGPANAWICDECIDLAAEILAELRGAKV